MSFDNHYPRRKDRRKPYRGSRAADPHCRNHGACDYCRMGREHASRRRAPADDPDGDDGILWDDRFLSDHLLGGERLPMFFDDPEEMTYFGGDDVSNNESDLGHGVAMIDITPDAWLVIRPGRPGRLHISLGHEDPSLDTPPVAVDLGALLVDLQLTWEDCRAALDGFGDQGSDRPDDKPEPTQ